MRIKQDDIFALAQQLTWADGTPIDLTTSTGVTLKMYPDETEEEYPIDGSCMIDPDPERRADGFVIYQWQDGETKDPGMYRLVFKVDFPGNQTYSVPNGTILPLWIMKN